MLIHFLGTCVIHLKGVLDFGLLCLMEKRHQFAMLASIVHIVNGDWGALVYDLTEMDVVPAGTNLRRVTLPLAKIWSVALKYHFRMPPYYTLVLRSLASLEGLAVAADQNFKTFQAAYPYVVCKLIYDNSAATRRILYLVLLLFFLVSFKLSVWSLRLLEYFILYNCAISASEIAYYRDSYCSLVQCTINYLVLHLSLLY